jgi:hypothetical protein
MSYLEDIFTRRYYVDVTRDLEWYDYDSGGGPVRLNNLVDDGTTYQSPDMQLLADWCADKSVVLRFPHNNSGTYLCKSEINWRQQAGCHLKFLLHGATIKGLPDSGLIDQLWYFRADPVAGRKALISTDGVTPIDAGAGDFTVAVPDETIFADGEQIRLRSPRLEDSAYDPSAKWTSNVAAPGWQVSNEIVSRAANQLTLKYPLRWNACGTNNVYREVWAYPDEYSVEINDGTFVAMGPNVTTGPACVRAISGDGLNGLTVSGTKFSAPDSDDGQANWQRGIFLNHCKNVVIDRIEMDGFWYNVWLQSGCEHVSCTDSKFFNGRHGFVMDGSHTISVSRCESHGMKSLLDTHRGSMDILIDGVVCNQDQVMFRVSAGNTKIVNSKWLDFISENSSSDGCIVPQPNGSLLNQPTTYVLRLEGTNLVDISVGDSITASSGTITGLHVVAVRDVTNSPSEQREITIVQPVASVSDTSILMRADKLAVIEDGTGMDFSHATASGNIVYCEWLFNERGTFQLSDVELQAHPDNTSEGLLNLRGPQNVLAHNLKLSGVYGEAGIYIGSSTNGVNRGSVLTNTVISGIADGKAAIKYHREWEGTFTNLIIDGGNTSTPVGVGFESGFGNPSDVEIGLRGKVLLKNLDVGMENVPPAIGYDVLTEGMAPNQQAVRGAVQFVNCTGSAVIPKIKQHTDIPIWQTLTPGASVTPDYLLGASMKLTLDQNTQMNAISNAVAGQTGLIVIDNPSTYTVTWASGYQVVGGTAPVQTTTGVDVYSFIYESASLIYLVQNTDFQ